MFLFGKKKETKKRKPAELGRDESKILECTYKNKKKCPDDCDICCFTLKQKGDFMMQVEGFDTAAQLYVEAIESNPEYADAWVGLGKACSGQGDYERALEAYDRALDIDRRYGEALLGRAEVFRDMKMPEEAMEALEQVLKYYDYEPCRKLRHEINMIVSEEQEKEAKKLEEKNRLLIKMMRAAAKQGYIENRLPTIPSLSAFADEIIPLCFIRLTGAEKYTMEVIRSGAVCCFYVGLGMAGLWKLGYHDLTAEEAAQALFDTKGFACMDEAACELNGVDGESAYAIGLKKFANEASKITMSTIMNQVGAVKMEPSQMEELVKESMKDVYVVGAGIGLNH